MDDNTNVETPETVEISTEDNSAYLTALCLVGFGAAIGVGITKGYSKVKGVWKAKVADYRVQKADEALETTATEKE